MADNENQDPAGDTQQFRLFAERQGGIDPEEDEDSPSNLPMGLLLAAIVIALLIGAAIVIRDVL